MRDVLCDTFGALLVLNILPMKTFSFTITTSNNSKQQRSSYGLMENCNGMMGRHPFVLKWKLGRRKGKITNADPSSDIVAPILGNLGLALRGPRPRAARSPHPPGTGCERPSKRSSARRSSCGSWKSRWRRPPTTASQPISQRRGGTQPPQACSSFIATARHSASCPWAAATWAWLTSPILPLAITDSSAWWTGWSLRLCGTTPTRPAPAGP